MITQAIDPIKYLYIKTYGCQMNVYDSQRMEEALAPLGFVVTEDLDQADLSILNGCQIREKAEDKLFSDLGRLRIAKKNRKLEEKATIIIVAGCVGQALGQEVIRKAPYVDVVVGPQTYHTLPETVTRIWRQKNPERAHLALGFPKMEKFDELPHIKGLKGPSAFLSIQEGCNKFCRYCVVPYTRGPEYSRSVKDIMEEAQRLVALGAKEITLLGQNVNAYHGDDGRGGEWNLGRLLLEIGDKIPEIKRLRYTTSHPRDVDDDLLKAHRDVPAVMPFLHLPVQSGSDRVLARMNRKYTQAFYIDIIDRFRAQCPQIAFSSDFIVGYPDETDEDFQQTLELVERVKFAQAFSFKYSPRPGTPAAMARQLDETIKDTRLQMLQKLLMQQRRDFNDTFIGKEIDVLVEAQHKKDRGLEEERYMGRSPFMHTVRFTGPRPVMGDCVKVRIDTSLTNSLIGHAV